MRNRSTFPNSPPDSAKPTLEELKRARPIRGRGVPSRCFSHRERIHTLLRERGPAGVLSSELYDSPHLYGRSPRNRVSELRADGCLIETVPAGASVVKYILIRDSDGTPPPRHTPPPEIDSADWFERLEGKPRSSEDNSCAPDLPLFAGVR
jgi:hypothetical protein